MKRQGVVKAEKCLNAALLAQQRILKNYKGDNHFLNDPTDDWSNFLQSSIQTYEILFTTSKRSNPISRQWFGSKIKKVASSDPLLKYIRAARGVDYHGIETVLVSQSKAIGEISARDSRLPIQMISMTFTDSEGKSTKVHPEKAIILGEPQIKLIDVTDHHGITQSVPKSHLGQPIENPSLTTIADFTMKYFKGVMLQAKDLMKNS